MRQFLAHQPARHDVFCGKENKGMTEGHLTRTTLDRFLVQCQDKCPAAAGELTRVLEQIGLVGKIISGHIRRAALEGMLGLTGEANVQGEKVKKFDDLGNRIFMESFDYVDIVGALVSEEMEQPALTSGRYGKYVVLIDPIDGSSNLDMDCVVGSIFSIHRGEGSLDKTILKKGSEQVAAGYLLYGFSTLLVYTAGDGVHSFVLDEQIGEFILNEESIRMPEQGGIISANWGNYGRWLPSVRTFADSLTTGEKAYSLRYSGALAADLNQILHQGGIYFYPEDDQRPEGKLRLLYECAPLAMIAEQAGGAATTGKMAVSDIRPSHIHQRVPFAIGSREEIRRFEAAWKNRAS